MKSTEGLNKRPEGPKERGEGMKEAGGSCFSWGRGVHTHVCVYVLDRVLDTKFREKLVQKSVFHIWSKYCQRKVECEA